MLRHLLPEDQAVAVRVTNPQAHLGLNVEFNTATLPHLFQWRLFRQGTYILNIEPANTPIITDHTNTHDTKILPILQPAENQSYQIRIAFTDA